MPLVSKIKEFNILDFWIYWDSSSKQHAGSVILETMSEHRRCYCQHFDGWPLVSPLTKHNKGTCLFDCISWALLKTTSFFQVPTDTSCFCLGFNTGHPWCLSLVCLHITDQVCFEGKKGKKNWNWEELCKNRICTWFPLWNSSFL